MTHPALRVLCAAIVISCVACAPSYIPPVPTNPLGDEGNVRIDITPVYEANPKGPLQIVLRKNLKRRWITLGQVCDASGEGVPTCPAHRTQHVTYVTPGEYKVRAEWVGPTARTFWGSVIEEFEAGYVYACEVTDDDGEGCQRTPLAEATAAAAAPPVLTLPAPTGPSPAPAPGPSPAPSPTPTAGGCQKDVDCPGDLICRGGQCVSPSGTVAPPPPVEVVPTAPAPVVTVAPKPAVACDTCPGKCLAHQTACNGGKISSCFELGACMCECKLAAGGCGDTPAALRECISTNRGKANKAKK